MNSGDNTLIPFSVGREGSCLNIETCVVITDEQAILRISSEGECIAELKAEQGETKFSFTSGSGYLYIATISVTQRLAYMKYSNGELLSSCDYSMCY